MFVEAEVLGVLIIALVDRQRDVQNMLHERKTRIELQFGVTIVTRASRCARSVGKSESCGLERLVERM